MNNCAKKVSNRGEETRDELGRSWAGFASEGESFGGEGGLSILGSGGDWRKGRRTAVVARSPGASGDVREEEERWWRRR